MTWTGTYNTTSSASFVFVRPQSYVNPDLPVLVGQGDPDFSTCTDLEPYTWPICWDVNGYYRDLGVHWKATKRELFLAYRDGDGPNNARLTYVFKQLLNADVRARYDRAPLGSQFVDKYVMEALTRAIKQEMARRGMDQGDPDQFGRAARFFGFDVDDSDSRDDTPDTGFADDVDKEPVESEDVSDPPETLEASPVEVPFQYPYYLWRSTCGDRDALGRWQALLVAALAKKGVKQRISIGFHGRMAHPWVTAAVGYRTVVFLNQHIEFPTVEMADAVAEYLSQDQ